MITYENFVQNGETETIPVFFDVCYDIRFFVYFHVSDKRFGFQDRDSFNDRFLTLTSKAHRLRRCRYILVPKPSSHYFLSFESI